MGLDIYHYKAVFEKPESEWLNDYTYVEENFDTSNVPFNYFQKHIQLVDYQFEVKRLIIVLSRKILKRNRDFFDLFKDNDPPLLVHSENTDIALEFKALEDKENLSGLEYMSYDTGWGFTREYFKTEKRTGFYYSEIGYQRKGVNSIKFNKRFLTGSRLIYALKEDFEYLYTCIDHWDIHSKNTLAERFKADFLDKYEEGASFLFMG